MLDCSSLWRFAAVRLSTTGNANCFFGVSLPSAYPQREMRTEKQSKPRQLGFFYTLQVRNMDIKFYYVNPDYIEHLKKAEIQARKFTCVPNVTYANRDKFFYGAVIKRKNGMCYYVPISSQAKNDANKHKEKNDYATDIIYRNTCRCYCFRFGVQMEEKG